MIRLTVSVLTVLLASSTVFANVQVFKILDGSAAYCDSTRETQAPQQKVLRLQMLNERGTEDTQDATLSVSLVKCSGGQWTLDTTPGLEKFTAPNGAQVEITYSDYELLLVNKNYDILLQTKLDYLTTSAVENQSLSVTRTREIPQDLEVIIRARKHVKASNGIEYSETLAFGGFRVRLN